MRAILLVGIVVCILALEITAQQGYEVSRRKSGSDKSEILKSTWNPNTKAQAIPIHPEPLEDNRDSKATQRISYSWSGTRVDWFIRQPGIYATNNVIFTVASNNDVLVDWEDFNNLEQQSPGGRDQIPIWYAIGDFATPPPAGDASWVSAEDLNLETETMTLWKSPELESGLVFKRWYKIEVSQSPSANEYEDNATVGFLTYNIRCNSFCPVTVHASVAQWTLPSITDSPKEDRAPAEEVEVWWWDGEGWVSQGIGNPEARARVPFRLSPNNTDVPPILYISRIHM